jgi:hypothetical protein
MSKHVEVVTEFARNIDRGGSGKNNGMLREVGA